MKNYLLAGSFVIKFLVEQVVNVVLEDFLSILFVNVLKAAVITQLLRHCEELAESCELLVLVKKLLEGLALLN